jgi:hypothetical protein
MDPNACLAEIRQIVSNFDDDDFPRLADLIAALDGWITDGGFKPTEWEG